MARIRSIKPEFGTDGKVRRLSDSTALFFVLLWGHCDDAGYFPWDPWELALKTGRWRSQEVAKFLASLVGAGLVRCSTGVGQELDGSSRGVGVGLVEGWSHQRIDKPRPSKWKDIEIRWDAAPQAQEHSKINPRKDRRGEDRIGEDRLPAEDASVPATPSETKTGRRGSTRGERKPNPPPKTASVWLSYSDAYLARYGVAPATGARVRAQMSKFIDAVGADDAPAIAAFYVWHNGGYYVQRGHDFGLCLADATVIRKDWLTGVQTTRAGSQAADRTQSNVGVFQQLKAELAREREGGSNG